MSTRLTDYKRQLRISRRGLLKAALAFAVLTPPGLMAARKGIRTRSIPSSGEPIPLIGMGTWITYDVDSPSERKIRVDILQAFLDRGGKLVDSSPMYGRSEETIGYCLRHVRQPGRMFPATKVWTPGRQFGINQMSHSERLWGVTRFDLMQVHNLVDWRTHLATLRAWKAQGRIRYLGITTSHGRRHRDLAKIMRSEPLDFIQITYNLMDREAESVLLPLAAERGIGVIINRPFRGGALFDQVRGRRLPEWTKEFDCHNWAQYFLKFVVSHPAVTCAIPATSQLAHLHENMEAAYGVLPDPATRQKMLAYLRSL